MKNPFNSCFNPLLLAAALCGSGLHADSLWNKGQGKSMFADKKATQVGDLITIIVQESNAATKSQNTSTSKDSSIDASISSFLYPPSVSGALTKGGQLPAMKMSGKNAFSGGGSINNSETLNARIAVRVMDILPNNNLVIEGRRQTAFSGEKQEAILRGVVRSEDVTAANTVFSYNVADASIQFISNGTITDNQKKGWFTKVWDKVNPF